MVMKIDILGCHALSMTVPDVSNVAYCLHLQGQTVQEQVLQVKTVKYFETSVTVYQSSQRQTLRLQYTFDFFLEGEQVILAMKHMTFILKGIRLAMFAGVAGNVKDTSVIFLRPSRTMMERHSITHKNLLLLALFSEDSESHPAFIRPDVKHPLHLIQRH